MSKTGLIARQTKIGYFNQPLRCQDYVGRFDIAVDNPGAVGMIDGAHHLLENGQSLAPVNGTLAFDFIGQRFTLDIFHDNEPLIAVFTQIIDTDNIGIFQLCQRPRFGVKAAQEVFVKGQTGRNHFQGDHFIQFDIMGFKNHAHAAAPQLFQDAVVVEFFTDK